MTDKSVFVPLDEEEADLAASLERLTERPPSLLTLETRAEIEAMARATVISERQEISIQLSRTDLARLRARAENAGVSYDALISAIIHKYVSG